MTGYFGVYRDELVAAADAMSWIVTQPRPVPMEHPIAHSAFGAPDLAGAVADFSAAWQAGQTCMLEECEELAGRLAWTAHTYTAAEAEAEAESDFRHILDQL
ncbi:MAG TPA: hypothetical protein VLJ59_00210 [Mycobacteriales bacterium]|nr:hypothetical protein [Mycobacteriales bacterium]